MSEIDLHKNAFRRAVIAGDEAVAEEARSFLLREYKREGLDYGTALSLAQRTRQEAIQARDANPLTNFFKGMGAGAVGMGETAALGIAALQEEKSELESREKILGFFDDFKPTGYDEEAITSKVGSGIGSIGALAPAALAGKFAIPIAAGVSIAAGAGESSERARASGATEEERGTASILGGLLGVTEVLPLGRMFKPFEIKALDKLISVADPKVVKTAMDRVKNAGKTGTAEGLQEFGAAVGQNAIERGYNPEQELVNIQAAEEGAIGGTAGAIFQGVIDTLMPSRRTPNIKDPETSQGENTSTDGVEGVPPQPDDQAVRDELDKILAGEDTDGPTDDDIAAQMAGVSEEQAAGIQSQMPLPGMDTLEDAEGSALAQEELTAGENLQQPTDFSTEEIDAAIAELTMDGTDPTTLTEDDVMTMAALKKEPAVSQPKSPRVEQPQQLDMVDNVNLEDNAKRNEALVSGEQQDMFALEGAQDRAGLNQRRGQAARAQEKEQQAAAQQKEMDDMFAEDEASRQRELDLEGLEQQPARGQTDMFLNGDIQDGAPETARQEPQTPEPPTNEVDPQMPLSDITAYQKSGIKRPRNQQRRIRKGLDRGQAQRQSRKDRQAAAKQRMQEIAAQRKAAKVKAAKVKPAVEPTSQLRSPEEIGKAPVAAGVQLGMGQMQQPAPQVEAPKKADKAPEYKGETYSQLMKKYNKFGLRSMADKMGVKTDSTERAATIASRIVKSKKKTESKNETKPTNTSDKSSPTGKTAVKPATKPTVAKTEPSKPVTPKQVKRNVTPRKGTKNVAVTPPAEATSTEATIKKVAEKLATEKKGRALRQDRDALALNDYIYKHGGMDAIAFDLARGETSNFKAQPADKVETFDADTQLSPERAAELRKQGIKTDQQVSGTSHKKAKAAMRALEAMGDKAKDQRAYIKRRMGESDISVAARAQKRVEGLGVDESGTSKSASEVYEIKDLERSIAKTKNEISDMKSDIADLQATKNKSLNDKTELRELQEQVAALESRIKQSQERIKDINDNSMNLPLDALTESTQEVPFNVRTALTGSRLSEGLTRLGDFVGNRFIKRISRILANNAGTTKVVVMKNLTSPSGVDVAGYYSPKENTIYLDSVDGMNVHTVLHEAMHAVTSQTLAKKSSGTTKQLQKIFDETKDKLGTAYGTKNLDEFVAEAFSNPEFQDMLGRIRPDGTPVSAWRRISNAIANLMRNLMGMESKPVYKSAMAEVDHLVNSIIQPAPSTRDAGELFMESTPDRASEVLSREGQTIKRVRDKVKNRKSWTDSAVDFIKSSPEKVTGLFNSAVQMQGLADLAHHYGFDDVGTRMLKVFNEQRGMQEVMDEGIQSKLKPVGKKYANLPDEQVTYLNAFVYDEQYGATIAQVDITKSIANYTDPEQREAYAYLKEVWGKMSPEARAVYKESRQFYLDQRTELENMLTNRINEAVDQAGSDADPGLRKKLMKQLVEDTRLEVYFPLMREGDYVLKYEVLDDTNTYSEVVEQFEGPTERRLYKEALANEKGVKKGSIKEYRRSNQEVTMKDVPPTSFMYDILKKLKGSGVPTDAINDVIDVYINTLPESSMAKSYKKRLNIAGYISDMNYALNRKGYQTGQQIVRLQHVSKIGKLKQEVSVKAEQMEKDGVKSKYQTQLQSELNDRADFVLNGAKNKGTENVIKHLNQGAFVFTIGFNVASALVNLSQVPMVALPMLAGRYGYGDSPKALMSAAGLVTGSRKVSREESKSGKALAGASIAHGIDKYYDIGRDSKGQVSIALRKDLDLPKERIDQLKEIEGMILEAKKQGQLTNSFLNEALGLEEGGKKIESGFFNKFTGISAGMFSQAERFNRQVTLIATYNLEYKKRHAALREEGMGDAEAIGQARKEATQFAIEYTQRLNGGSTLETASGLSQQGIGRIALMYKNYGIQMYTMMFQTGRAAISKEFAGSPELQRIAQRQVVGMYGSALFFSGVYGMPLYGAVAMAYDATFGDDDEDDFDTIVQSYMSQGMFRGGVNAMLEGLGADVDAGVRMRMTDLLLQENKFNPNPSAEEQIGGLVGGVALSIGKRLQRGFNDVTEGNYQRGMEQLLPAAMSNVLKPFRYAEEGGIRTRRYDLIHGDLSSGEIAAQVIGFAPEQYLRQQEQNRRVKNIDEAISNRASALTKKYYIALRSGNYSQLSEIYKDILDFNQRNPQARLSPDKIQKSLKGHLRTTSKMYNGVSISKTMQDYLAKHNQDVQDTIIFPDR